MSADSPAVILYDSNGVEMAVSNGVAIPGGTKSLLVAGSDGTNARTVRTTADGTVRIDPTGTTPQPVTSGAVVDTNNSTSIPLGSFGVFTGTPTMVLGYSQVTVMISTDQPSLARGISLEFSPDGVLWNHSHQFDFVEHDSTFFYGLGVHEKFFRVVYKNAWDPQTSFVVQVLLKPFTSLGSVRSLSNPPDSNDDALLAQAALIGRTGPGLEPFRQVRVTAQGLLKAESDDVDIQETLKEILTELRKQSAWLEMMTGVCLDNGDVE